MRQRIVLPVTFAAAVIAALLAAFVPSTPIDGIADDAAAAARIAMFGARDMADAKVVALLLDESSMREEPLRSMPRALMSPVWAALAQKAFAHGADNVGLDFILAFAGADLRLGDTHPLESFDTAFMRLLLREGRAGRLVIGRSKDLTPTRRFAAVAGPRGLAHVDITADSDGVVRHMWLGYTRKDGAIAPTLAGALTGQTAALAVPLSPPAPLTDLPTARVIDVLNCNDAAQLRALFAGRSVLIGSGLPGEDRLRAPDRFMPRRPAGSVAEACAFSAPDLGLDRGGVPGALLHAAAVDAVRSGWALTPVSALGTALVAAVIAGAAAFAGMRIPLSYAAGVATLLGIVGFAGAAAAQEITAQILPAARPIFAAALGFAAAWAGRLFFLDRRARALRASFGRYVAPELVERILAQDQLPELDGEQRAITVMFADLSGFTALSEQVDSKTLTATVNRYLGLITDEVTATGGYVDKYIGDAVMAIWNAPVDLLEHERAATRAAVAIRDAVAAAAVRDSARGLPHFAIKVGVYSGDATVGNVGSAERLNYTAVGDTVNIAARLEGLPSVLQTPVVVGAECAKAAAEDFAMLEVASIQVKGRKEPVAVFAPYTSADRAWFPAYAEALHCYRDRAFAEATEHWHALATKDWSGADLSAAMAELAALAATQPLPDDWPGAVLMQTK